MSYKAIDHYHSFIYAPIFLTLFYRVKLYCNLIWFSHAFNIKEEHNFKSLEMFSGTVPLELGNLVSLENLSNCVSVSFFSFIHLQITFDDSFLKNFNDWLIPAAPSWTDLNFSFGDYSILSAQSHWRAASCSQPN